MSTRMPRRNTPPAPINMIAICCPMNTPWVGRADRFCRCLVCEKLCDLALGLPLGLPLGLLRGQDVRGRLHDVGLPLGVEVDDERLVVAGERAGAVAPHGDDEHGAAVLDGGLAEAVVDVTGRDSAGVP